MMDGELEMQLTFGEGNRQAARVTMIFFTATSELD
jgi:hypothetical protein